MSNREMASGSWNRVYYALGAFAVFSTGLAVYLSDVLLDRYAESVAINQEWAERSASYSAWGSIAAEGNAPGNDVFETELVAEESAKLDEIVTRFDQTRDVLIADLKAHVSADMAVLLEERIRATDTAFQAQIREARDIFAAFQVGDREKAGRHMASMDRYNAQAAAELGRLAQEIQSIQAGLFKEQLNEAAIIRSYELGLIGLVVLMVLFTVAYGRKLSAIFRESQARIERRNQDMGLVLDNVVEGLAMVSLDGRVSAEASSVFVQLLGAPNGVATLWELLGRQDPDRAMSLELGFESLTDGFMPHEVVLAQLPSRFRAGSRTLSLELRPILSQGELISLLAVVQDISETLEQERREAQQAEMLYLFNRIMHDRHGIEEFTSESAQIMKTIQGGAEHIPLPVARRLIHTLKGNAGFFGLKRLANACHTVEDRIDDEGVLSVESLRILSESWSETSRMIRHLLGDVERTLIEIEPEELDQALRLAQDLGVPHVERAMRSWRQERLTPRLERIQAQVEALSKRLGKQVRVEIDSTVHRMSTQGMEPFWSSLTHILRNAVDHGIETPEEREQSGKHPEGTISLRASQSHNTFVLEIADDGRGIDWQSLAKKARANGISTETHADLQRVLFTAGLSTSDQITDISGRGVGMGAIVEATRSIGGQLGVRSERGYGTCFRFEFPIATLLKEERLSA